MVTRQKYICHIDPSKPGLRLCLGILCIIINPAGCWLPATEFYLYKNGGYSSRCKQCERAYNSELAQGEKRAAYDRYNNYSDEPHICSVCNKPVQWFEADMAHINDDGAAHKRALAPKVLRKQKASRYVWRWMANPNTPLAEVHSKVEPQHHQCNLYSRKGGSNIRRAVFSARCAIADARNLWFDIEWGLVRDHYRPWIILPIENAEIEHMRGDGAASGWPNPAIRLRKCKEYCRSRDAIFRDAVTLLSPDTNMYAYCYAAPGDVGIEVSEVLEMAGC